MYLFNSNLLCFEYLILIIFRMTTASRCVQMFCYSVTAQFTKIVKILSLKSGEDFFLCSMFIFGWKMTRRSCWIFLFIKYRRMKSQIYSLVFQCFHLHFQGLMEGKCIKNVHFCETKNCLFLFSCFSTGQIQKIPIALVALVMFW